MNKISVVISAFNEEKNITDCLKSVRHLADEIIVVDNESSDKTAETAESLGAKVSKKPNNLMLNINKNFGFTKATGDWILNLDADERVTEELAREIKDTLELPASLPRVQPRGSFQLPINGYWVPRKNIIFGKWIKHSLWWPDEQLRLFRNGKGRFPEEHVHEHIKVEGKTGHLKNSILHYNYSSISQFLYKLDKIYTENEAENFLKSGQKIECKDALKWPSSDFIKTYFLQNGYKDGIHGLVLSLLQAFYTLITFVKIWEKQGFPDIAVNSVVIEKEIRKIIKELDYWLVTIQIEETKKPINKSLLRLKRKLKTYV